MWGVEKNRDSSPFSPVFHSLIEPNHENGELSLFFLHVRFFLLGLVDRHGGVGMDRLEVV